MRQYACAEERGWTSIARPEFRSCAPMTPPACGAARTTSDPASYDFAFTDAYLKPVAEAGTEVFYRLGVTIENFWTIKAYRIDPPKDFGKWARICEHIIRHYNEGWADGFRWNLRYWEVWCEPENPPLWQGTREQFFELYRVAVLEFGVVRLFRLRCGPQNRRPA